VRVNAKGEYPEAGVTVSQAGVEDTTAFRMVELDEPVGSVRVTLLEDGIVAVPTW
jgi:hypothetical protein